MALYMNKEEEKRVQSFIDEKRSDFEKEQDMLEYNAKRRGETYQRKEFQPISEDEALQVVRLGWKSHLEIMFEKKRKQEEAQGIKWGKLS